MVHGFLFGLGLIAALIFARYLGLIVLIVLAIVIVAGLALITISDPFGALTLVGVIAFLGFAEWLTHRAKRLPVNNIAVH